MEEILLLDEEIEKINREAKYSLLNNPGFIAKSTKFRSDIYSISPLKKLIFIRGDSFTGLEHINLRHRFYTNAYSPVDGDLFVRTSRFSKSSGTLFDYHKISELIYTKENLDSKNKDPEKFEVYRGTIDKVDYRMVLYKGTKIVHTLFPLEKGKIKRKFEKLDIVAEWIDFKTLIAIIPYFDSNQTLRYGIGVTILVNEHIEKWNILIYENGNVKNQVILGEQKINYNFDFGTRVQQINYADVTKFEDIIDMIEEGKIK